MFKIALFIYFCFTSHVCCRHRMPMQRVKMLHTRKKANIFVSGGGRYCRSVCRVTEKSLKLEYDGYEKASHKIFLDCCTCVVCQGQVITFNVSDVYLLIWRSWSSESQFSKWSPVNVFIIVFDNNLDYI